MGCRVLELIASRSKPGNTVQIEPVTGSEPMGGESQRRARRLLRGDGLGTGIRAVQNLY